MSIYPACERWNGHWPTTTARCQPAVHQQIKDVENQSIQSQYIHSPQDSNQRVPTLRYIPLMRTTNACILTQGISYLTTMNKTHAHRPTSTDQHRRLTRTLLTNANAVVQNYNHKPTSGIRSTNAQHHQLTNVFFHVDQLLFCFRVPP